MRLSIWLLFLVWVGPRGPCEHLQPPYAHRSISNTAQVLENIFVQGCGKEMLSNCYRPVKFKI